MKKFFSTVLVFTLLFSVLSVFPGMTSAAADTPEGFTDITLESDYRQTEARSMLAEINEFRTGGEAWYWNSSNTEKVQTGVLKPLTYSYDLEKAAMQRAAEIAVSFSHTRPDGRFCFTAGSDFNISINGENIAAGYGTAHSVYIGWREDDDPYAGQGHRRNMLGNYTHIGIGHAVVGGIHYWVQEFGRNVSAGTETSADGNTAVPIRIENTSVLEFTAAQTDGVTLAGGESAPFPQVTGYISMADTWRRHKLSVACAWTVESGSTVILENGTLTGHTAGSTNLTASVFGQTVTLPVTVTSTAHVWGDWAVTVNPSCTETGTKSRCCTICKVSESETLSALGHVWGDWTVTADPSCTETGSRSRSCTVCKVSESKPLPALGHDYKQKTSEDGSVVYACDRCDTVMKYLPGDVTGDNKVNSADRTALARHLAGWTGYAKEDINYAAADVNGDEKVTSTDRTFLARALAGWEGYTL